jgi:hypothetical protein
MNNDLNTITSPESLSNLVALWQGEANEFNADSSNAELISKYGKATAQGTGYGYCSDFYKYEAGNGVRPRWMSGWSVEHLAEAYATMYREAREYEVKEAEGESKEEEAMNPSPAYTIGDLCAL